MNYKALQEKLARVALLCVVFVTGAVVLAVEVMAIRMLAPFFGNTMFTFSSIISVILAALSVGYWYGGRLADRRPELGLFYTLVTFAGISVLGMHIVSSFVLPIFASILPLTYGPLVSALFLFFVPAVLFGMLSPLAIRLRVLKNPSLGIGTVSGEVFFCSTLGSIFGSLISGFALIPFVGLYTSMLGAALLVVGVGVIGMLTTKVRISDMLAFFIMSTAILGGMRVYAPPPALRALADSTLLYDHDGYYEQIRIFEGPFFDEHARILMLDRQFSSGITWPAGTLLFPYTRYIDLYRFFQTDAEHMLVLGAGSGTVAKTLHEEYPEALVEMVDIEPSLFMLAHKYFGVPNTNRIQEYVADGRQFLRNSTHTYDLIFGDMYATLYTVVPHVTTVEYYQTVYNHLSSGGVYMGNYIGDLLVDKPSHIGATIRTMREVFEQVYVFAVASSTDTSIQNYIVLAVKGDNTPPLTASALRESADPVLVPYADHFIDYAMNDLDTQPIFTDNRAPVEFIMAQTLARNKL